MRSDANTEIRRNNVCGIRLTNFYGSCSDTGQQRQQRNDDHRTTIHPTDRPTDRYNHFATSHVPSPMTSDMMALNSAFASHLSSQPVGVLGERREKCSNSAAVALKNHWPRQCACTWFGFSMFGCLSVMTTSGRSRRLAEGNVRQSETIATCERAAASTGGGRQPDDTGTRNATHPLRENEVTLFLERTPSLARSRSSEMRRIPSGIASRELTATAGGEPGRDLRCSSDYNPR